MSPIKCYNFVPLHNYYITTFNQFVYNTPWSYPMQKLEFDISEYFIRLFLFLLFYLFITTFYQVEIFLKYCFWSTFTMHLELLLCFTIIFN